MQPEEDPEARIRELERTLNDQARSSELGTGQSGSGTAYLPPPVQGSPPPPAYGTPAYGTPEYGGPAYGATEYGGQPYPPPGQPYGTQFPAPRKTGGGISWAVFGLIAFVVLAVAAGVVVFTTKVWNSGVSGGGGSIEMPAIPSISIPSLPAPSASSAPETPTAAPGAEVTVSGMGETKTIVCNDGPVSVSGISNNVTITGHCVSVTVSGMSNQITLDAADTISASGFDNRVTYHSGAPQVDNSGSNNTVEQG